MAYFKLDKALIAIAFVFSASAFTQTFESTVSTPDTVNYNKLKVNQATVEQLVKIKGLGQKKAKAIVDYIELNGDLVSLDELLEIRGIGKRLLLKLKSELTL